MSISVVTLKRIQFISLTQDQINFHPNNKVNSISVPTLETSPFYMPPDAKTKLISIQTRNQDILYFWPLHKTKSLPMPALKSSLFRPPHTTTKSISMPTLKQTIFRSVFLCVLYIPSHVVIQQQHVTYNVTTRTNSSLSLTFPYYSKTSKVLRRYFERSEFLIATSQKTNL